MWYYEVLLIRLYMLNNKVIFLMWLYCVLCWYAVLCNVLSRYKMNTRDGEREFSPELEPAFWVGHLLGYQCGPNIWARIQVWRPSSHWILSLRGPHPLAGILWDRRVGSSNQGPSGDHWRCLRRSCMEGLWGFHLSLHPLHLKQFNFQLVLD